MAISFHKLARECGLAAYGEDRNVSGVREPGVATEEDVIVVASRSILRRREAIKSRAWIVSRELADLRMWLDQQGVSYAISGNPLKTLSQLIDLFHPVASSSGIDPSSHVSELALLEPDVRVGAGCVIEEHVCVGAGSVIDHRVVLMAGTVIGKRVRIQSGTVIGMAGFGFYEDDGSYGAIRHVGRVVIGDDVHIGANCTIARGTLGDTAIGRGCVIDNLVQIAHNVSIGEDTAIAAQVGIAGSTVIGARVRIGGQAGLVGHIRIGDGATIGAQAGVIADVPSGVFVAGYPAEERVESLRKEVYIKKIPGILDELKSLRQKLK